MPVTCISVCDTIDTQTLAPDTGTYTLKGVFNGRIIEKKQDFNIGELLAFDTAGMPENYVLELEVLNPGGNRITITTIKIQDVKSV